MRRYWLFAGPQYESLGGMNDFQGSFNTVSEAIDHYKTLKEEWYHIFDNYTKRVTHEQDCGGLLNLNLTLKEDA